MDLTWVPGVATALIVSGAQHILFTGRALQRLDEIGRRMERVEDGKVDKAIHEAVCGTIGVSMKGEVSRLDGRIDHVSLEVNRAHTEILSNRERLHAMANKLMGDVHK